jgi:hypothetical protein
MTSKEKTMTNIENQLVRALMQLLEVSHCTNGCDIDDTECATSVAIKAVRIFYPEYTVENLPTVAKVGCDWN